MPFSQGYVKLHQYFFLVSDEKQNLYTCIQYPHIEYGSWFERAIFWDSTDGNMTTAYSNTDDTIEDAL